MELTKEKALELSILKWELIVEKGGYILILPNEFLKLKCGCGLCELYRNTSSLNDCIGCPFIIEGKRCYDSGHAHRRWAVDNTKENAQIVLDELKKLRNETDNKRNCTE